MTDPTALKPVQVEQCDREAAAEYLYGFSPDNYVDHIKETKRGYFDATKCVQAFARHRLSTSNTHDELVSALEWIRDHARKLRGGTDDWFELVEFEAAAVNALARVQSLSLGDGDNG
jgi:hypothetical protein